MTKRLGEVTGKLDIVAGTDVQKHVISERDPQFYHIAPEDSFTTPLREERLHVLGRISLRKDMTKGLGGGSAKLDIVAGTNVSFPRGNPTKTRDN